jgi:hypothetical protein
MGSSKQTQKQTQTRDPYNPAKPAIDQSIKGVQSWLNNPASKQAYQGDMSDWTKQGLEHLAGAGGATQSRDYLSGVLNGDYLNAGNPYQADLDASIKAAVMPGVNSTFSQSGMSGSTLHQGALMQGLTSGLAAPRYQNYQMERGNQQQAAGMLPGVDATIGQQQVAAGQSQEAYDRAKFEEQRLAKLRPYLETQGILQGYGNMGGTTTGSTTSKSTPSLGSQIAGGAMTGIGMMSGIPGMGMIGQGLGNAAQGAPWSYGSSWSPWVQPGQG